jgi:phospholipid/cholesterol/gamma-HCH transport system permease protein
VADERGQTGVARLGARLSRASTQGLEDLGLGGELFAQSLAWLVLGRRRRQPVRLAAIFEQMMSVGIDAILIVSILAATIGLMLAMQSIDALKQFGAETLVVLGIAPVLTREFAPLITGILVAGRSGSALAARLASMTLSQEIDALMVIGVNPVRFLVVPALLAMIVMLPMLTFWSDLVGFIGAGLYVTGTLGMSWRLYYEQTFEVVKMGDVLHGIAKAAIFAVLITIVGVVNGATVTGGAEGVGRVTTRSVVQAISAIIIADMIYVYLTTR